jgi:hypothetical protein
MPKRHRRHRHVPPSRAGAATAATVALRAVSPCRGRRCSYYANAGSFSRPATAGANSVAFTGRSAGRAPRPGSYRVTLTRSAPAAPARNAAHPLHGVPAIPRTARPLRLWNANDPTLMPGRRHMQPPGLTGEVATIGLRSDAAPLP